MKLHYLLSVFFFCSCGKENVPLQKNQKIKDEQCFITNQGVNFDSNKKSYSEPSNEEILKKLPKHISQRNRVGFEPFLYQQKEIEKLQAEEKKFFESSVYKKQFGDYIHALPEFNYLSVNGNYALAKNKYGLWIVEKTPSDYKPYFLGITQNFYVNDLYGKNQKFLHNNEIVFNGTLVNVKRLSRVPMLPKYEIIKDGVELSISLDDIKRDQDRDGYNDLFEEFIGLNPKLKDTDGDGINDFEDTNPKYSSEQSKFAAMYEAIVGEGSQKKNFSFSEILTDCVYFQKINPKNTKVLVYNTDENCPLKDDVLDNFFPRKYSKISTYKDYPDVYFMDFSDETGNGTISAEFSNGNWKVDKKYTITFGV